MTFSIRYRVQLSKAWNNHAQNIQDLHAQLTFWWTTKTWNTL
jgi:hypothetical protein